MTRKNTIYQYVNEYRLEVSHTAEPEPDDCIAKIYCKTTGDAVDDQGEIEPADIASSSFTLITNTCSKEFFEWVYLLDIDAATAEYIPLFNEDMNELCDEVQQTLISNLIDHLEIDNVRSVFTVDKLEVLLRFRGMGFGELIIAQAERRFAAGTAFTALIPILSQFQGSVAGYRNVTDEEVEWERDIQLNELPSSSKVASEKLDRYYQSIGFENTVQDIFIRPNANIIPS
jgi:hypothetical protein